MTELQFNSEVDLAAPEPFSVVRVEFKFVPPTSGCTVYGYDAQGDIQPIQIKGSGEYDLPYCNPKIYVRFDPDMKDIEISTVGWADRRALKEPGNRHN